jgi:hypothetical protein
MTMELSSSFILMTMVTLGRALKTISLLLGSRSSRSGWESTVFAYLQLSIRTRPRTSSMLYYLFVPPKQLDPTLISGRGTRHFAFAMPMSSRLLALIGIELDMNDTIMNYTATPLMDGSKAWRGPREKDIDFMSSLIMATTYIGQVMVDVNAGVGMS